MKLINFTLSLTLAATANAQTLISVGPTVAAGTNAGISGPIVGVQTTLRTRHGRLELVASGEYNPRYVKAYSGDGKAYGLRADLRVYASKNIFGSVGFQRATAYFDNTSRTATHVSLGGGWSDEKATVAVYWCLPDRTRYRLSKLGPHVTVYRPLSERLVFVVTPGVEVFWYQFEGRQVGVKPSISAGIGVRL